MSRLPVVEHLSHPEIDRRTAVVRTRPRRVGGTSCGWSPARTNRSRRRPPRSWSGSPPHGAEPSSSGTTRTAATCSSTADAATARPHSSRPSNGPNNSPPCRPSRPTAGSGANPRWRDSSGTGSALRCGPRPGGRRSRTWGSGWWCRARGTRRPPRPSSSGCGFDRLGTRLAELRRDHPDKDVELWCEDEARLRLKPVVRRVRARKGNRPPSNGRRPFESVIM